MHLIDFCCCYAPDSPSRAGEIVGQANIWTFVFGVFAKTFASYHDWDGGFGDDVVGEGAENDTVFKLVKVMQLFDERLRLTP